MAWQAIISSETTTVQDSSIGQDLLNNVFKHLNLTESAYFGLRFMDASRQAHWLESRKKIVKQLKGSESFTLYFGVKFYIGDPCKLAEEITRYQFFLQIKQDILQGRLSVPNKLLSEICAYAVQSELGDYDPALHSTGYISEFHFVSNQSIGLEAAIAEIHQTLRGQTPAIAELSFLEKIKWLEMYGVDLHPVLGQDNLDYFLGLTPSGIIVLRNKTKVGNYLWPRIDKITHKGRFFMLRVKNKTNEDQTYGFETPTKSACKHLWKCSVEHHAFFRLVQVVNNKSNVTPRNSRFRDSTRSDSSFVKRRVQPQFVRTPSKRFQRRVVEGSQDAPASCEFARPERSVANKVIAIPQQIDLGRSNEQALDPNKCDSPRSVRSTPWLPSKESRCTIPSPKSVRSAGVGGSSRGRSLEMNSTRCAERSVSVESSRSGGSRSPSRRRRKRSGKSRTSDNDSEVSKSSSRRSRGKSRRHKSGSSHRRESGSESETSNRRQRHKYRHSRHHSGNYEFVDSEIQWKRVQQKQIHEKISQDSVRERGVGADSTPQHCNKLLLADGASFIGRPTSPFETLEHPSTPSLHEGRKHRRSHKSLNTSEREKRLSSEVQRHLEFNLIETDGMSQEQLRQIPYTKVETNELSRTSRYISSSSSKNAPSFCEDRTNSKQVLLLQNHPHKYGLPGTGDSPPPPYSATVVGIAGNALAKPHIPLKPSNSENQRLSPQKQLTRPITEKIWGLPEVHERVNCNQILGPEIELVNNPRTTRHADFNHILWDTRNFEIKRSSSRQEDGQNSGNFGENWARVGTRLEYSRSQEGQHLRQAASLSRTEDELRTEL